MMHKDQWPEWGAICPTPNRKRQWEDPKTRGYHWGYDIAEKGEFTVIQCQGCVLNHVVPIPQEDELAEYYQQQFYTRSHPDYLQRYVEDREWWQMHHEAELNLAYQWLGTDKRPHILDVGCGPALLLDTAAEMGWHTYGAELDATLARRARNRGHRVDSCTLDTIARIRSDFDVVSMYEVLEHLPAPEDALLRCHNLLAAGGLLYICVPNDFNPLQLAYCMQHNRSPYWVAPPEHLNYFTPKMLQLMVRRCGFDVVDIHGTFALERFLLGNDTGIQTGYNEMYEGLPQANYVGNDQLGKACHKNRQIRETIMHDEDRWDEMLDIYRNDLNEYRAGREIRLWARKS